MINLQETFEKYEDEYLKFERVKNPPSKRPDLCAFIAIDRLVPDQDGDIVSAAEHDEIYLDVSTNQLAHAATEENILLLVRCGIRYDAGLDSLCMFV